MPPTTTPLALIFLAATLSLPILLTFLLISLMTLTTLLLLLGHLGALLSTFLQLLLPIPILTTYLSALESRYALLVTALLALVVCGSWIWLDVKSGKFQGFAWKGSELGDAKAAGRIWQTIRGSCARAAAATGSLATKDVKAHTAAQQEDLTGADDRTVIHDVERKDQQSGTNARSSSLDASNPFIRRILRDRDYDDFPSQQLHNPRPAPELTTTSIAGREAAVPLTFSPAPSLPPTQPRFPPSKRRGRRKESLPDSFVTAIPYQQQQQERRSLSGRENVVQWDEGAGAWIRPDHRNHYREQEGEGSVVDGPGNDGGEEVCDGWDEAVDGSGGKSGNAAGFW